MTRRTGSILAVLVLLATAALVFTDSFYAELGARPEDAGVSSVDVTVRGVTYLAVPVGLASLLIAFLLVVLRRAAGGLGASNKLAWVLAVAGAAGIAMGTSALFVPGFGRFTDGVWHIAGIVVAALALTAIIALASVPHPQGNAKAAAGLAWTTLLVIAAATASSLLLAQSAAEDLASRAEHGERISPGALDPMQLHATPACVLPLKPSAELTPIETLMKLGSSSSGVLLYDRDAKISFLISPARVGTLGVANEVCRTPGEATPVEVGTPAADAALARRFRPILQFDSREPWRPLNVERFLSERFADPPQTHDVCAANGTSCEPLQSSTQLTRATSFINVRGTEPDGSDYEGPGLSGCPHPKRVLECDDPTSSIYYHVVRADHRAYVDYWWFLRYDQVPAPGPLGGVCGGPELPGFVHEGDWEGMTVVSKFHEPDKLAYVAYAAHNHRIRYTSPGVVTIRGTGGEQRPVVDLACGTHAAYPGACAGPKGCRQTAAGCAREPCDQAVSILFEAPFDGKAGWSRNEDARCFTSVPCLLPLPATAAGAPTDWGAWAGHWGKDESGPRTPAKQDRFERPWLTSPSRRAGFGKQAKAGKVPASPPREGR